MREDRTRARPEERAPEYGTKRRRRVRSFSVGNVISKLIAVTVLILLVLVMVLPSWKPHRDKLLEYLVEGLEYYQEDPEYSEFKVERVMTLNSPKGNIVYTLFVPIPEDVYINGRKIQEVISFETSNSDLNATLDETEGIKHWSGSISGATALEIRFVYHIRSYTADWNIYTKNSGTIEDIPDNMTRKYIRDRWVVYEENREVPRDVDEDGKTPDYRFEPSNPLLKNLAKGIVGEEDNVFMMAQKIYNFLKKGGEFDGKSYGWEGGGFAYPTEQQQIEDVARFFGRPKPAYVTLHDGYGDCDDQAILFITLCRAVGIPAWLENGALYNQFSLDDNNAWEGHGWARMFIPMKNGDEEEPLVDPVNSLFLKRDANRFSDWEDPGGEKKAETADGELPPLPLDIETYYTAWSYRTDTPSARIEWNEYYDTHFYNSYQSNMEIKV